MKRKFEKIILGIILISLTNCESKTQNANNNSDKIITNKKSIIEDNFKIAESKNENDNSINEYLDEKLKPIRENFKKLNSIQYGNWSNVETKYLEGSNEGGEVTYYSWNEKLDKIITKEFGETYQVLTEYYLIDNKLSFVFQKGLKYNRSIWKNKPENSDKEVFDIDKSKIIEKRSYFENGKLIYQINNEDNSSPMSNKILNDEQAEIETNFKRVLKIRNEE
jgi:hypothetical protein